MSSPSPSPAPAEGDILGPVNAFISARDADPVPTVISNVLGVVEATGKALRTALGTTVDAALGVTEAVTAAPNNAAGLATQAVNAAIVRPIHNARAAMRETLFGTAA